MHFVGLHEFAQSHRSVKVGTLLVLVDHMIAFDTNKPFLKAKWKEEKIFICILLMKFWWLLNNLKN